MTEAEEKWLEELFTRYESYVDFHLDDRNEIDESVYAFKRDFSDFSYWKELYDEGMTPKQALREELSYWSL